MKWRLVRSNRQVHMQKIVDESRGCRYRKIAIQPGFAQYLQKGRLIKAASSHHLFSISLLFREAV
jgi:hypothetical protein